MAGDLRAAYLFISLLQARVGATVVRRLGDAEPAEVLGLPLEDIVQRLKLTGNGRKSFEMLERDSDPDEMFLRLAERGIQALTLGDEDYPEKLREIPDSPPALFVKGEIPNEPMVALVGSCKASATGSEAARALGRALDERGVCVTSGLALGIDAAAHQGALAAGGSTVGVLGCGIDVVYPKSNQLLFKTVEAEGGIVSEYYLGEQPLQWHFPARNRVVAGLSDAVVVVEAAEKSGALITARHAMEAGRDVWAVPGPLGFAECRGSNALLADGAGVVWDVDSFVDAVVPGPEPRKLSVAQEAPAELPEREAAALAGVGFEPAAADVVATRSGVGIQDLLPALAMLELKGYVTRDAGGAFVRNAVEGGAR